MLLVGIGLFSPLFVFLGIFFQSIMRNILQQAIYYAQAFCSKFNYLTVTSCTISHHMQILLYNNINCADILTVLLEYIDLLCSVAKYNE